MKVLILQLSDIHIASAQNPVLSRIEKLRDAANAFESEIAGVILLFSGDIAYSGNTEEYRLALSFSNALIEALRQRFSYVGVVAIPGNHDCTFDEPNAVRDILMENVSKSLSANHTVDSKVTRTCLEVQKNFFRFLSELKRSPQEPYIITHEPISVGQHTIVFQCYNTAWMSRIHETQGSLIFPTNELKEIDVRDSSALHISVLHHPYNWFESNNARNFKRTVEATSHLIFTGHEHESEFYTKSRSKAGGNHYFEGGVLFDKNSPSISVFNVVALNLAERTYRACVLHWSDDIYQPQHETEWKPIELNAQIGSEQLRINESFHDQLLDVGANFTHPRKSKLTLNDLFVFPEFQDSSAPTEDRPFRVVKEDDFMSMLLERKRVFISGREKIGKTTLLKVLYLCIAKERSPLMISGADLKEVGGAAIKAALRKQFDQQYRPGLWHQWEQLPTANRILFIDDFHKIPVNGAGRSEILRNLVSLFDRIVVTSAEEAEYDDVVDVTSDESTHAEFEFLAIMEFGYKLREKLVRKWYSLGNGFKIDLSALDESVHEAHTKITTLLGKNLIPSYPLFTLILLQQLEAGKNNTTANGSYGYMYEYIITEALAGARCKEADLDTKYSYLANIAFTMFGATRMRLSEGDLIAAHKQYLEDNDAKFEFTKILKDFLDASILEQKGEFFSFKYPYQYYYFTARHFSLHAAEQSIAESLHEMCSKLYIEDFANIIIFYTYLTQDKAVIRKVLEHARSLYANHTPFDFAKVPSDLLSAHKEVVTLEFDSSKIQNKREDILDSRGSVSDAKEVDDAILDETLLINDAFKTLQILGQILRNFPGSLGAGLKREITNECYLLGLRMLTALLSRFSADQAALVEHVGKMIVAEFRVIESESKANRKAVARHELEARAKEYITQEFHKLAYGVVRRIVDAVGSRHLLVTYDAVKSGNRGVSFELVDIAIRMDYAKPFPTGDVVKLAHLLHRTNMFSFGVLRHFVWVNMYVFHKKDVLRQALCQAARIGVTNKHLVVGRKV